MVIKTDLPKVEEALGEFLAQAKEAGSDRARSRRRQSRQRLKSYSLASPGTFVVMATLRSETRRASALW